MPVVCWNAAYDMTASCRFKYNFFVPTKGMLEIQACSEHDWCRSYSTGARGSARINVLSLLILFCDSCIFLNSSVSPITLAASRTSRQVSSKRVMTLTIVPSATSVRKVIWSNGLERDVKHGMDHTEIQLHTIPFAHSYTTSTSPVFRVDLNSSAATLCRSWMRPTRSVITAIAVKPSCSLGGITGSTSVFSWKTKQERSATTSSGS